MPRTIMKADFNRKHPELREGEVFITNADTMSAVYWLTAREGKIAYDIDGNPLGNRWPGSYPVFALRKELEAKGVNTANM